MSLISKTGFGYQLIFDYQLIYTLTRAQQPIDNPYFNTVYCFTKRNKETREYRTLSVSQLIISFNTNFKELLTHAVRNLLNLIMRKACYADSVVN